MTTRAAPQDSIMLMLMRVRRRWGVFAVVFVLVASAILAARYLLVPQYTAMSAVLIEPDRSPIARRDNLGAAPSTDSAEVESQVQIIRSTRLLQDMLKQEGVRAALLRACEHSKAHSPFGVLRSSIGTARQLAGLPPGAEAEPCTLENTSATVDDIGKSFTIFQVGRSRVVSVNFQSSLPDTASLVVNALVGEYLTDNVRAKSVGRMTTARWLEDEGAKLRQSLVQKEQQIDKHRREHGLLRGQQGLITQENLTILNAQLGLAKARSADATARYGEVRAAAQRGDDLATVPSVLGAGTIRDLRTAEANLRKTVGSLTTQYGAQHPRVAAARNELSLMQASLSAEADRIVRSLATEVARANGDQQALEAALDRAKSEAASAADADSAVQSLVRDADIDRQLYFVLASRSKELETETRAQNSNVWLVSQAETPVDPSFPKTIPFAGVALLLGLISGAGAAFVRDYADNTLRDIDDFADDVNVPVLARIPVERGLSRRSNLVATASNDRTGFREAIRALYAHVQLRGNMRTILVTSSAPREGKTSVSVALAHFAAAAGQRVLLIEADMRMPVFSEIMPLRAGGLARYFQAPGTKEPLIEVPYGGLPNFHVLPAGRPAQNSTELLNSARMAALVRSARSSYDLVVIDTPPASYLMDACVLARLTDGVIFAAKWGQSQPELMRNAMHAVKGAGGNIIGTVIGMVGFKPYSMYGSPTLLAKRPYMK